MRAHKELSSNMISYNNLNETIISFKIYEKKIKSLISN